jgi:hypothetical protein
MRHANRSWMFLCAAIVLVGAAAADNTPPAGDIVSGAWQHHKLTFSYVGFTSLYTCDGLEAHVRQILMHLGARKDLTVSATGCPGPFNTPSRSAFVNVDFFSLAPAEPGSDTVQARWTAVEVTSRRPDFMGAGDCELIQNMKDLITQNFSMRDLKYRTDCFPHEVSMDGFAVRGQALRALPSPASARG